MLETSDESVSHGEKNQCTGAQKQQTRMDTRIKGDTRCFEVFWKCDVARQEQG